MEKEVRERAGNGDDGDRKKKKLRGRGENAVDLTSADDADVEEFFAIIRRIHEASRLFSSSKNAGGGDNLGMRSDEREEKLLPLKWTPSFEWEDFEETDGVSANFSKASPGTVGGEKREERVAENGIARCPDLNAEPEPERVTGQWDILELAAVIAVDKAHLN